VSVVTSADQKSMMHFYQEAIAVTTAVINEWDPYDLIVGGAPKDEFEGEVSQIVAKAREVHTPEALARLVSDVFSSSFEPGGFSVETCLPVASRLFEELQIHGFLERKP
jgi:hypothetical protein